MSRLPMVPQAPKDPATAALFEVLRQTRGPGFEVPHLYRVLALSPALLKAWVDFAWPLRLQAQAPRKIRELLILRGAQISATAYEWAHHVPMALQAGVTQAQIEALAMWQGSNRFDAREKAVLQLAEEVTRGPSASRACIEALKCQSFEDAAIMEMVLTASFYVCVGRFLGSMEIELEPGVEPPSAEFFLGSSNAA